MPLSKFSPEQLTHLKCEFDNLQSIEDKFRFWPTKLNFSYAKVGVTIGVNNVNDFLIHTTNEDEVEKLNVLTLEEAKIYSDVLRTRHKRPPNIDFDYEKKELDRKLINAINPLPILNKERQWIEQEIQKHDLNGRNFFEAIEKIDCHFIGLKCWGPNYPILWNIGYEDYYVRGKEPDLRCYWRSGEELLALMNGYSLALYHKYIDKIEWEYSQKRSSIAQEETTRKQQLLILFETGMLDSLNHLAVKDRNKLLSVLLNRSETNIRMELNKIHKKGKTNSIRNEENLAFLSKLFAETGLEEKSKEIKNELDELR
ncbi:hypothetical protein [Rufibacter roseus]|uniref:Uncharacterized protein n=1 Tax=Rufibacter roseus TaxID=1567108 RepID=A0ABW2DMY5_9BACT|nr:hypothetical protein [Rufibacter roseus]